MRASKVKTIRSLDRGLDVLLALEDARAASLHDLHRHTGLPKATLTRILLTLEGRGLIWQRVADSMYRPAYSLKARARRIEETDRIVEAASPVLLELTRTTGLAAHLAVPRDDHMEICEARRPNAPLKESRRRVGRRVNMPLSAMGRVYLAFSPADERDRVLERLRKSEGPGHDLARHRNWVKNMLEETRRQGYGARDPVDRGDADRPNRGFRDDTTAIAVPIIIRGRVVGAINLLWRKNLASTRQIARRYLKVLSTAAARIERRLGDDPAT